MTVGQGVRTAVRFSAIQSSILFLISCSAHRCRIPQVSPNVRQSPPRAHRWANNHDGLDGRDTLAVDDEVHSPVRRSFLTPVNKINSSLTSHTRLWIAPIQVRHSSNLIASFLLIPTPADPRYRTPDWNGALTAPGWDGRAHHILFMQLGYSALAGLGVGLQSPQSSSIFIDVK